MKSCWVLLLFSFFLFVPHPADVDHAGPAEGPGSWPLNLPAEGYFLGTHQANRPMALPLVGYYEETGSFGNGGFFIFPATGFIL